MQPLTVTTDAQTVSVVLARLASGGWDCRRGWGLPESPYRLDADRIVLHGVVASADDVGIVVEAACRGVGIVALAVNRDLELQCLADLRRVAPAQLDPMSALAEVPVMTPAQRAVLELIARGHSVGAAARTLNISVRTAERRLSEARQCLGVSTTAEAVARIAPDLEP